MVLDLGVIDETVKDIKLKLLHSSGKTKLFIGTPLLVQTDGSKDKSMTAKGCVVYDFSCSELVQWGDKDFCIMSNEAKYYTIL